ncbi:formylglycine-generating enzyme family protein [Marichromatium gracile]|uniref:formylglycine-generating enzyme family protein n=1 Tax=Marichromatium gracile TaxID=1048 RepID=UPI001404B8B2|nr:SUMF1/EgtB/PvdO family nonheme iron enzyme [Marichromatium gracile]
MQTQNGGGGYDFLSAPSVWEQPNRPRVMVAWIEAMAYCAWLTNRFKLNGVIGDKEEVRLPTEYEWEKSARGVDGLNFPWGDKYECGSANINESFDGKGTLSLGETVAVGFYLKNVSPYGLFDCSGNVWEWCINSYDDPEDVSVGSPSLRALRGGSFMEHQINVRTTSRNKHGFVNSFSDRGFRLVLSEKKRS